MRREVEQAYLQDRAESLARGEAISFGNYVFDHQMSLLEGAADRMIESGSTEFFKQNEAIPGLGFKREINQEAFNLEKGDISQEIEVMTRSRSPRMQQQQQQLEGFYVIQLLDVKDSYLPDFEEAKEDVEKDYRLYLAEDIARQEAQKTLEAIKLTLNSSSFTPLSATRSIDLNQYVDSESQEEELPSKGGTYRGPLEISGLGSVPGIGSALSLTKTAFAMEPGQISNLIENYQTKFNEEDERVQGPMTGVYILQVLEKIPPPEEEDTQQPTMAERMERYMEQRMQSLAFSAWIDEVSAESNIRYNTEYLEPEETQEEAALSEEELNQEELNQETSDTKQSG